MNKLPKNLKTQKRRSLMRKKEVLIIFNSQNSIQRKMIKTC